MRRKQMSRNLLCVAALLAALPIVGHAEDVMFGETFVTGIRVHEAPINENDEVAGGQLARTADFGALGNRDTMTTPMSITTFTDKTISNVQADNIVDVIALDASTNNQSLSGASQAWAIRGFRAQQQDVSFNGVHGVAPRFYTGVEGVDRVEVLKGASTLLYGISPNGSVGGNINYVPKRAKGGDNENAIKLTYGDGHQFSQQLDLGERSEDNKWGVHATVFHRNGSTATEDEKSTTTSAFLGIDRQGSHSRLYLDGGYIYNDIDNPQYRVIFGNNFIGKVALPVADNDAKYGAPGTYRHVTEKFGVARYEYDFSKDLTAYAAFGMRETKMDYFYNEYRLNAAGTSSVRYRYNNQINKAISAETGVKGRFETGDLKHEVTVAATRYEMKRYMANRTGSFSVLSASNLWGRNTVSDMSWQEPLNDVNINTGVAFTDVISTPNDAWTFVVGARYQKIKQTTYPGYNNTNRTSEVTYDAHAWSPAFAVVRKLNDKVSVYANYMQGLTPGDLVDGGYANDGEVLAPYKTKQIEIGAKFNTGKFLTTFDFFQMRQAGTMDIDIAGQTYLSGDAEVRNRGFELSTAGELREGTRLLASLMYLDAKYTKADANQGNTQMGTPHWQAVARVEQDIKSVKGLSFSLTANYQGSSYVDAANTTKIGGRTLWNIGSRYEFNGWGHPMMIRADVYNLFDKDYWNALSNTSALYIGKGRTAVVSWETRF